MWKAEDTTSPAPPAFKSGGPPSPPDFEIENQFVYFVRLRSDRNLDIYIIKTQCVQYAESEFHTSEFVICKFNIIHMNIK